MKKIIWVVDNDKNVLDVIKRLTEEVEDDIVIETLSDPMTLRHKLENEKPYSIFLDANIAEIDAFSLTRTLKSDEKTKDIRITLMSPDVHIDDKIKEVKADSYLRIPFTIQEFLSVAREEV